MIRWMWWSWGGISTLAVVLAVVAYFAWQGPQEPRLREFRDFDMCLLTGQGGVSSGREKDVIEAMRRVQDRTDIRTPWYALSGEQTPENASEFVGTLVQQRCRIIVTVGQIQADGVALVKGNYPNVTFIDASLPINVASLEAELLALVPQK